MTRQISRVASIAIPQGQSDVFDEKAMTGVEPTTGTRV
jgi:hypothetical protein